MSFILLGILNSQAAAGGAAYYIAEAASIGADTASRGSFKNGLFVYALATNSGGGGQNTQAVAYDLNGNWLWNNGIVASGYDVFSGTAIDSSGNVYASGTTQSLGSGNAGMFIKFDSLGNVLWQRGANGSQADNYQNPQVDSAGNVYFGGHGNSNGSYRAILDKLDTNGNVLWQKNYPQGFELEGFIEIDSNDDIYQYGQSYNNNNIYLYKIDGATGNPIWAKNYNTGNQDISYDVAADDVGYVYLCGSEYRSPRRALVIKIDASSGAIVWQKHISSGSDVFGRGIAVTPDGSAIYAAVDDYSATLGGHDSEVIKFDSAGTVQWQRKFGTNTNNYITDLNLDNDGELLVNGYVYMGGDNGTWSCRYPSDGSITGTYAGLLETWNIVTGTLSVSSSSLSTSTASISNNSAGVAISASSLTVSSIGLSYKNAITIS